MSKIVMEVMDRTGDTKFEFDTAVAAEMTAAEAKFRELMGLSYRPVGTDPETGEKRFYKDFDPTIKETVFRLPLQGG